MNDRLQRYRFELSGNLAAYNIDDAIARLAAHLLAVISDDEDAKDPAYLGTSTHMLIDADGDLNPDAAALVKQADTVRGWSPILYEESP